MTTNGITTQITDLPLELVVQALRYVDDKDQLEASKVSRLFRAASYDMSLTRGLLTRGILHINPNPTVTSFFAPQEKSNQISCCVNNSEMMGFIELEFVGNGHGLRAQPARCIVMDKSLPAMYPISPDALTDASSPAEVFGFLFLFKNKQFITITRSGMLYIWQLFPAGPGVLYQGSLFEKVDLNGCQPLKKPSLYEVSLIRQGLQIGIKPDPRSNTHIQAIFNVESSMTTLQPNLPMLSYKRPPQPENPNPYFIKRGMDYRATCSKLACYPDEKEKKLEIWGRSNQNYLNSVDLPYQLSTYNPSSSDMIKMFIEDRDLVLVVHHAGEEGRRVELISYQLNSDEIQSTETLDKIMEMRKAKFPPITPSPSRGVSPLMAAQRAAAQRKVLVQRQKEYFRQLGY